MSKIPQKRVTKVTIGENEVWVNPGSVARYSLMKEDCLIIKFNSAERLAFNYGDSVERGAFKIPVINGKTYMILEPVQANYDMSMGAWKYDLRLDASYMRLKDYVFMLPVSGKDGIKKRTETKFSMTGKINEHLDIIRENLELLGMQYNINVDNGVGGAITDTAQFVQYDCISIYDALTSIADKWMCEWWCTDDGFINFGRLENVGDESETREIRIGEEAKNIVTNKANGKFATRLYAFGGTKNLTNAYGRELLFHVGVGGRDITDPDKKLKADMFRYPNKNRVYNENTVMSSVSLSSIKKAMTMEPISIEMAGGMHQLVFRDRISGMETQIETDNTKIIASRRFEKSVSTKNGVVKLELPLRYFYCKNTRRDAEKGLLLWAELYIYDNKGNTTQIHTGVVKLDAEREDITRKEDGSIIAVTGNVRVEMSVDVEDVENAEQVVLNLTNNVEHQAFLLYSEHEWFGTWEPCKFSIESVNAQYGVKVDIGGTKYDATFNPYDVSPADVTKYNKLFIDGLTVNIEPGTEYKIVDGLLTGNVPNEWFEVDDSIKLNVVENRIKLPAPGYIDAGGATTIVEESVVFDDIYPKREEVVTGIKEVQRTINVTDNSGTTSKTFKAYILKCAAGEYFSQYEVPVGGDGLSITFGEAENLSGMTFEVNVDKTEGGFEIIANETYGVLLPDETMKPVVGDKFVLFGYDAAYVDEGMIYDAQKDLELRARAYLEKISHNDRSYTVTLNPTYVLQYDVPNLGDRLELDVQESFTGKDVFRVIGYEVKLDIDCDDAVVTCGEQSRYSRLETIENNLKSVL